jgi:hypothetical protein
MKFVFIGGSHRSGTTMLGSMLGAHSSCLCIPEAQFKIDAYKKQVNENGKIDSDTIFAMIRNHLRFRFWGIDVGQELPPGINSFLELFQWLIERYGEKVGKPSATLCVDHTPLNIKYADLLFDLFPESKMIHLVRDGRGVAASIMPLDWGPNTIDKSAFSWIKNIQFGFRAEALYGSERVKRVRYEDVVLNPEMSIKEICTFLDIAYEPAMINGGGFVVPAYTAKQHDLVGKGPVAGRVEAWKRSLTQREIEIFENMSEEYLLQLGYALHYGAKAKKATFPEKIIFMVTHGYRKRFANKFRRRRRVSAGVENAEMDHQKKEL